MNPEDSVARGLSNPEPCPECQRLLDHFAAAVQELLNLHHQQVECILDHDGDCTRFDLLIHMAGERKQEAKYAYLTHYQTHTRNDVEYYANPSGT